MVPLYQARRLDTAIVAALLLLLAALATSSLLTSLATPQHPNDEICGTASLPDEISDLLRDHSRFIALVGDGVPSPVLVKDRPYNTQYAQGYDLYQGVKHGLGLADFTPLLDDVGVLYIDDGANPTCAARIANLLRRRAELLAVIGHSTTACTGAALPYYKLANVPVIVPAATNPVLLTDHSEHAFRLPSNDLLQALVIADLVAAKLEAHSLFVVWDATAEAQQYAEYLKNQVQHFLTLPAIAGSDATRAPIIEGSYPISLNPFNYSYIFRRIVSTEPDTVIFAGYGSLAREFLLGLSHEYSQYPERKRPAIILTDGCRIPGLETFDFNAYITFAAGPLSDLQEFANFEAGPPVSGFQRMYLEESFEVFGYDASVLLLSAVNSLLPQETISRARIIRAIEAGSNAPTCYKYEFRGGENIRGRYFVYSLADGSVAFTYGEDELEELLRRSGSTL